MDSGSAPEQAKIWSWSYRSDKMRPTADEDPVLNFRFWPTVRGLQDPDSWLLVTGLSAVVQEVAGTGNWAQPAECNIGQWFPDRRGAMG